MTNMKFRVKQPDPNRPDPPPGPLHFPATSMVPNRVSHSHSVSGPRGLQTDLHPGSYGFTEERSPLEHITNPNPWVIPTFRPLVYHVVSVGYRKCPHVNLEDMVEDCMDTIKWCREHLENTVGGKVDLERLVAGGDSAGGCIATLLAHKLDPPPNVVVDI